MHGSLVGLTSCLRFLKKERETSSSAVINFLSANQHVLEMVRWTVVSSTHQGSSSKLASGARIFLDLFQTFDDVRSESFSSTTKAFVVTLLILRPDPPANPSF